MWWVFIVMLAACCRQSLAIGWAFESNNLPEGSSCNTTSETGICRPLSQCEPLANGQVDFTDPFVCGINGTERVICCPTTTPTTPPPVESLWELIKVEGIISPLPPNEVTEENSTLLDNSPEASNSIPHPEEASPCNSPSGVGVCKPIHLCEPYRDKTLRYADLTRCSFIGFDEIVCCPKIAQDQGNSSTGTEDVSSRTKMRPSVLACQKYNVAARSAFHISGGKEAGLGEFPYVGAVLYPSAQSGRQYDVGCGASLISEQFALTAAHCVVKEPSTLWAPPELVRFGSIEWNPRENTTYRFDAKIKNITVHDLYRTNSYYHDIAVIEFTEPVPMSMLISPICLHPKTDDIDPAVQLQIVGWGISSMYSYAKADVLQKTDLTTVSLFECNSTHVDYGVSVRYSRGIIEGQYCAFNSDFTKDSCSGDSGGPLILTLDDWEELVGVISFGKGCGSILPSIYTRVAHYLEWIEKIVWPSSDIV